MSHNFANIPAEMRFYKQWVTWRYEEQDGDKKPTKVLYNPIYKGHASVDKPDTWVTYNEAVEAYEADPIGWAGIGFVLTENDPYGFVDLDNTRHLPNHDELFERQQGVFNMFESYAELSPSGTGLHIITKGSVERGRKRAGIEVYSNLRFMTMTGNVYRDAPIIDEDIKLKALWHKMGGAAAIHAREANFQPETDEDAIIKQRMFTAENGKKARELYEGHWAQHCGSWSEADQALINIIVFYTKNKEQIVRLFQSSQLGTRKKAFRVDYLDRTISLAFDRDLPPADIDGMLLLMHDAIAEAAAKKNGATPEGPSAAPNIAGADAEPGRLAQPGDAPTLVKPTPPVNADIIIPPGLVGEIAEFVYAQAPSPIAGAALVAALGLIAGIAGRSYNISANGLNQYFLFLAPTGTGKEAISSGISKLVHAVENGGARTIRDHIGPGQIRSDMGLINWVERQKCCVSILGEFGMKLKSMSDAKGNPHQQQILTEMLNMYGKSGYGNVHYPSAYADKEKTTEGIPSPNFSVIGESTQERFYDAINEKMVHDGLLPRFSIFEYNGQLPTYNEFAGDVRPSTDLVQRVAKLVSLAKTIDSADKGPVVIGQSDDARAMLKRFKAFCTSFYSDPSAPELLRGIWSRGHMSALKLAGTVAVGINMEVPVIDIDAARWACELVARQCQSLYDKFSDGKVGEGVRTNEDAQHKAVVRVLADWLRDGNPKAKTYGLRSDMQFQGCVTQSALVRRLVSDYSFKREYGNSGAGVKEAIKLMLGNDEIRQLSTDDAVKRFGTTAICYMVTNPVDLFAGV